MSGPHEPDGRSHTNPEGVYLNVDITVPPFSTTDRHKRSKTDRRLQEMAISIQRLFQEALLVHLYPRTVIDISLYIVAQDGGFFPACINAATLALVDAGISMYDYVSCCSTAMFGTDPLLDPCHSEEQDVSFVTTSVIGKSDKVSLLLVSRGLISISSLSANGCLVSRWKTKCH